MKIDLTSLKKLSAAVPDLKIEHLVAILSTVVDIERNEKERDRMANKRQQRPTSANNEQQQPTREQQEKQLYALATEVCGKNSGGFVTALMKQNNFDVDAVRTVFVTAKTKGDPREFVASQIRRTGNGTGAGAISAADRLIAREKARTGDDTGPLLDLTPTSSRIG